GHIFYGVDALTRVQHSLKKRCMNKRNGLINNAARSVTMIMLLWFVVWVPQAAHALTQTRSPGTCESGGGAGDNWSNPGRAVSSNNSDATVSVDGDTSEA